jgi:hypothetical protein
VKYGSLKQKNPEYREALWRKLDDLYVGGFQILERAKEYITKQLGESEERYTERVEQASYINYLGMVVDSYAANLFAQEPVVAAEKDAKLDAFWETFAKDADLKGDDFSKVLRCSFTEALKKQRALIACDFPVTAIEPSNRAEEDAAGGARAYAFELPIEEMIDWEYSEIVTRKMPLKSGAEVTYSFGLLAWAILRREISKRETPDGARDKFIEEFRVWTLNEAGYAEWKVFQTEPRTRQEAAPRDDVELKEIATGQTSFRQIPIVELTLPAGLWLGNKLGPIALELFRRRSALNASENRSLFPVAVVNLGPEIGGVGEAMPSEVQQNPNRGDDPVGEFRRKGFLVLGKDDKFAFVEPTGTAFEAVDKQIGDTVDEFFRVAHMMASSIASTSTSLGRSGSSKEQDYRAMGIVLEAYGAIVRDAAQRVYQVIAEARKEVIDWRVHGLDKFDVVDRAIVLEEAKSLALVSIPSNTFRAHWQTKVALALLGNVTPDMQKKIQGEIERGVAAEEQMRELMLEGMQDGRPEEDDDAGADGGRASGEGSRPARAPNGAGAAGDRAPRPSSAA